MQYQIGAFFLDVQARTLASEGKEVAVRPRTLTLLLYLAKRHGQVISKQELLDCVWDDVAVDDGVVFQSISEIRKLFANPKIIVNYPRRGYEFTQELIAVEPKLTAAPANTVNAATSEPISTDEPNTQLSSNSNTPAKASYWRYAFIAVLVCLLALASFMVFEFSTNQPPSTQPEQTEQENYAQTIVVLPIKNRIHYSADDWIYLGGMEQLIAKLAGLPKSILVHQGTYIPHLMYVAGLERDYKTENVANLFNTSSASLVVESEVYGDAYDYKLIYKLHRVNSVKVGVILASSIDHALIQLSSKIAQIIDSPLSKSTSEPSKEFNNALFAKAISTYESDWYSSISFFESYLQLNPESVIARIYLAKLYLWHKRAGDAAHIIYQTDNFKIKDHDLVVHLKLIKGLIAEQKQDLTQALSLIKNAEASQTEDTDLLLKIRIIEEQGKIYNQLDQTDLALTKLNQALNFYKIIKSPIGINSTRLELAQLHLKIGKTTQGRAHLNLANQDIQKVKLGFLYDRLEQTIALFDAQ